MRADALFASAGDLYTKLKGFLDDKPELGASSAPFSRFNAGQIASTERFLRRVIPALLIIFLILVALVRFGSLIEYRGAIESDVEQDLHVASRFLAAESQLLTESQAEVDPLNALLTSRLPKGLLQPGRFILVSGTDGIITAASPGSEYLIGTDLVTELALSPTAIQLGRGETTVPGTLNEEAIETSSMMLADGLGLGTIVQIERPALSAWREALAVNVTLFSLTSFVVLAIVLAYFRQASRANEAQTAYLETHELVDTALSLGRSGLWDWNVTRGEVQLSRSLYELLGFSPKTASIGFAELEHRLHPADIGVKHRLCRVVVGNVDRFDKTFRLRHRDGHFVWLRAHAEATRTSSGERHLVGIAMDVSEQQAFAERTKEAHHQLHSAIENIPETFVLCDNEDDIILANSRYRTVFGLSEEDTKPGTNLAQVMRKSRKPIESAQVSGSSSKRDDSSSEIKMPDGRWLLLSERRTAEGFIAIGADITQLKMHQTRLHESERRLTDIIHALSETRSDAERKAAQLEELNHSFRIEKNKAEAASRAKTTFLANMSHELRTPLNAILGFSDIMRQQMLGPIGSEKYTGYAHDIHESGEFLLQLIDDILDMQKIETGRTTMLRRIFDLTEAVAESARMIEASVARRQIDLVVEQPEKLNIYADRRAVTQILMNLMSNAVKFSDAGGEVRVSVKERSGAVLLSITDRGEGISQCNLAKIGRPFEQTESEWTRTKKGTGLGLAIARSLTELHGGRFRIASTLGEGTIVAIRLPNTIEEHAEAA
ncbi:putative sensor histidine kinase transmembrane protein [Fulvimarina pelagi HTCC2506]|uniref:histidine kinase n=1 Tax=Fulvimarina pelagi HTCC2506 TaxID=314231 RepID=Q0G5P1_9HYPH|nr:PAS domain-containing sensor histidine kinase [Fulvimarina pelagi]EAU43023.1 putative sensor histidine kinase transmembrane protein [Fulvimarina pelagi HTCC2506]